MSRSYCLFRRIGCLLLIAVMLLATGCVAETPTSSTGEPTTEGAKPAEFGTPILRFAVTSDVHTRDNSALDNNYERLEQFISTAYVYSESQKDYNKLDGMFFIGDITDNGNVEQLKYFFNYIKEHTKDGTVSQAVMGNHEYNTSFTPMTLEEAPKRFMECSGYDDINYHLVIGGYHFIMLALDKYNGSKYPTSSFFSEEKIAWLEKELKIAAMDDPTRPIFVFQHAPAQNTMRGSSNGDGALKELLSQYPQVIDFSGHTHRQIADPQAIWQDSFTALSTGSLAYMCLGIDGVKGSLKEIDEDGNWITGVFEKGPRNAGMYYIVEVDANHCVRILIYNIFTESLFGEPYIIDSFDPKDFRYTDARKDVAVKPEFDADAKVEVLSTACDDLQIAIPQAECKDLVQSYRVEVYKGDAKGKTYYRLSGIHYGDAKPETVKAFINGLDPDTEYTLKVYACSSWGLDSDPLVVNVTATATEG